MKEVRISLPDDLASDASAAGLLAPDAIEALLRATLKANAKSGLEKYWDKLDKNESTPEREAEILEQVRKVRSNRKSA